MNKVIELNLEFDTLVPNMARGRHVLVAIKNQEGDILTAGKSHWYAEGITRFAGGGIDEGEDPGPAAARELEEELQIKVNVEDLEYIAEFKIKGHVKSTDKNYEMTTYVYGYKLKGDETLVPSDDVKEIYFLNKEQQAKLIERYETVDELDSHGMNWKDYGKIYAPIHKYVFENF